MDKTSNNTGGMPMVSSEEKVMTTLTGHRNKGFSSAVFTAVTAAVGAGVNEMLSSGLTTGNAISTAAGALGAYAVTKATDASVGQALIIGGLAGSIGVAAGRKLDTEYFTEQTELSPAMPDSTRMLLELFD